MKKNTRANEANVGGMGWWELGVGAWGFRGTKKSSTKFTLCKVYSKRNGDSCVGCRSRSEKSV